MDKQRQTELVKKAQQGDSEALNELIGDCYQDIYYFALKTVKNEDIAGDVAQESCIEIMTTLDKLREPAAFAVWSRRITYHQCMRYFRETKNEVQLEENEDGETILDVLPDDSDDVIPEKVVEDKEFQQTMRDLIDSLPDEQRSALLLYYYEKMSVKEIADIQETTEGTVKSRLNYGRKAVKKKVEEYEEQSGTKLHSAAFLPLLLRYLFGQSKAEMPPISAPVLPGIAGTAGAASAAGTALNAASGVASGVASAAGGVAAKSAASALAGKIVAGALAAVVGVSALVGGIAIALDASDTSIDEEEADDRDRHSDEEDDRDHTDKPSAHSHEFASEWIYDASSHRQVCDCGETTEAEAHTYEGNRCTLCGYLTFSEGLDYWYNSDSCEVSGIGTCTDRDIVIPPEYDGLPVTGVRTSSFSNREELTSISIPDGVTFIGYGAFQGCTSLESVSIPDSVTEIQTLAFEGCSSLREIDLPDSLTEIGGEAFGNTSLTSVIIPEGVTLIGARAFRNCTLLTDVAFSDGIQEIGDSAFQGCTSLTNAIVPEGVTIVGDSAFRDCTALTEAYLPDSLTYLGGWAFTNCPSLTKVTLLGAGASTYSTFSECTALTSIAFPEGVTDIGISTVGDCTALTSITLPTSVTHLGVQAFINCSALTDIYYLGTMAEWIAIEKEAFFSSHAWDVGTGDYTVHCSDGDLGKYED